jgi:membrane-associated phospholipid phosphatase
MKYKKFIINQINESFRDVSALGSFLFVCLVIILLVFIDFRSALIVLIGLIMIEAIGALVKVVFHKKRPNKQDHSNILEKIDAGSFPSIHSARALLIGLGVYSLFSSVVMIGFVFLLVILVGISRIYLNKHYIIDVIGGYIFGFISWYITNIFINWLII